jgi:hypothetical protein
MWLRRLIAFHKETCIRVYNDTLVKSKYSLQQFFPSISDVCFYVSNSTNDIGRTTCPAKVLIRFRKKP